jgi:hypothetical protein
MTGIFGMIFRLLAETGIGRRQAGQGAPSYAALSDSRGTPARRPGATWAADIAGAAAFSRRSSGGVTITEWFGRRTGRAC